MAWRGTQAYLSSNAVAVTNAAHANGVRVVPTFQLFDSGSLTEAERLPRQHRRPGPVHRPGPRPHGAPRRPTGPTSTSSRCPRRRPRSTSRSSRSSTRRWTPASRVRRSSTRRRPGAGSALITGLVPIVDHMFVMTYNYRWTGLDRHRRDRAARQRQPHVKIHMKRFAAYAPKEKLIMGVPVVRLRLAGDQHRPECDRPVRQGEVRRREVRHVRLGTDVPRLAPGGRPAATTTPRAAASTPTGTRRTHVPAGLLRGRAERRREVRVRDRVGLRRGRDLDARQRHAVPRDVDRAQGLLRPEPRRSTRPDRSRTSPGTSGVVTRQARLPGPQRRRRPGARDDPLAGSRPQRPARREGHGRRLDDRRREGAGGTRCRIELGDGGQAAAPGRGRSPCSS